MLYLFILLTLMFLLLQVIHLGVIFFRVYSDYMYDLKDGHNPSLWWLGIKIAGGTAAFGVLLFCGLHLLNLLKKAGISDFGSLIDKINS